MRILARIVFGLRSDGGVEVRAVVVIFVITIVTVVWASIRLDSLPASISRGPRMVSRAILDGDLHRHGPIIACKRERPAACLRHIYG